MDYMDRRDPLEPLPMKTLKKLLVRNKNPRGYQYRKEREREREREREEKN